MDALITLSRIMLDIPADPVVQKTGSGLTPVLIIAVVAVAAFLIWKFYGKQKGIFITQKSEASICSA